MNAIKTLSYILFPLLLGLTVGGAIMGNLPLFLVGILSLAADIALGITVHCLIDRRGTSDFDDIVKTLSDKEEQVVAEMEIKKAFFQAMIQQERSTRRALLEEFDAIFQGLLASGRRTGKLSEADDADLFSKKVFRVMPHAPRPASLFLLTAVFADKIGEFPLICYEYEPTSEHCMILLVRAGETIRVFTLEPDTSCIFLCEYRDRKHINYGTLKPSDLLSEQIEKILLRKEDTE
jgi:hypothetical protein